MKTDEFTSRRKQLTYYKAIAIGVLVYWLALLALLVLLPAGMNAHHYWLNVLSYGSALGILIPIVMFLIVKFTTWTWRW